MDILQELALILDAGAETAELNASLIRGGVVPDSANLIVGSVLHAMRDKAVELHHLNHLPINTILGDPDGIAVAGESRLATLWHDMLNRTQRRRTD